MAPRDLQLFKFIFISDMSAGTTTDYSVPFFPQSETTSTYVILCLLWAPRGWGFYLWEVTNGAEIDSWKWEVAQEYPISVSPFFCHVGCTCHAIIGGRLKLFPGASYILSMHYACPYCQWLCVSNYDCYSQKQVQQPSRHIKALYSFWELVHYPPYKPHLL